MSRKLPACKPAEVVRALERAASWSGVSAAATTSSTHSTRPELRTSVPHHSRDLKHGTLRGILRDCELSVDDFLKLL